LFLVVGDFERAVSGLDDVVFPFSFLKYGFI